MKVKDLAEDKIIVGLRIKGLRTESFGTIVQIDKPPVDDNYAWVLLDSENAVYGGFWGNDCDCEVVGHIKDTKIAVEMIRSVGVKKFIKIFVRFIQGTK